VHKVKLTGGKVMRKILFLTIIFAVSIFAQKNGRKKFNPRLNINKGKLERLMDLKKGEGLIATIKTNMGNIVIELFPDKAPKTVENFAGLANSGYYNGIIFHRVIENFMIQAGDPTGTGSGGESIWNGTFEDEFSPELTFNGDGILAMANRGPNTNTSQFFITLAATPWLNNHHTIFGKVIEGLDVVHEIGKVKTSKPFDRPVEKVYMKSVKVQKVAL
jgi:cyclophilin family peptidyl-prolyl cis-trans isomerase